MPRDTAPTMTAMKEATMVYEVRAAGANGLALTVSDGKPRVEARAIVFDSWSVDLGGFKERMRPGSVELDADLVALFDHDTSMVLGRTSAGTMEVRRDEAGVAFSAYPPDTTWARDLLVSMERGDIKGCSYRMLVDEDTWYVQDGEVRRDVLKARISELTITSMPAYPQTTAEARSRAAAVAGHEDRAGRVLSGANEQSLKAALESIEAATETIKAVVAQVDPEASIDSNDDSSTDSPDEGGAPDEPRSTTGGAPVQLRTFVPGFGYINTKEK